MAHDLTEVVSLLVTDPDSETIDLAMELFTKSKAAVLSHLTQFWVEFNRMVTDSPSRSTVCKYWYQYWHTYNHISYSLVSCKCFVSEKGKFV